jgi:hypothetical protein
VDLRMLEAKTLDGICKLDVDREIVRVQLEPVLGGESPASSRTSIASVARDPSKLIFQWR